MKISKSLTLLIFLLNVSHAQEIIKPKNMIGSSDFNFLLWNVYKIRLYAEDKSLENDLALKLTYKRKLYGEKIAKVSIKEIREQNCGNKKNYDYWLETMKSIFPNVQKGDSLTGVKDCLLYTSPSPRDRG